MKNGIWGLAMGLFLVSAAGCQPRSATLAEEYVAELDMQADIFCECWSEYFFLSRQDCLDTLALDLTPTQTECYKDAFAQSEKESVAFLECYVALEQAYTDCINTRLVCTDSTSISACNSDWFIGSQDCISLPASVERDLDACTL